MQSDTQSTSVVQCQYVPVKYDVGTFWFKGLWTVGGTLRNKGAAIKVLSALWRSRWFPQSESTVCPSLSIENKSIAWSLGLYNKPTR